jgi:predicted AlkP superfamily pyrophosphatase or phosphodiesterase
MDRLIRFLIVPLCLCCSANFIPSANAADHEQYVVIVTIDGLAAYLLDDPQAPIPTIRKLAREGAVVGQGMKVSNPSVTWPNHTTLVTGVRPEKHGVLANGVLVRGPEGAAVFIDSKKTKSELVRGTTLFDVAHAAGMKTGDINWPCTRSATTLDDSFPDSPDSVSHSTPRFIKDLVAEGILADDTDASFRANSVAGRDVIWTDAACYLIRHRMPNLLLVHLLNVDSTHHTYGPQTPAGYTANAFADACLARMVQALDAAGVRERTTLLILADHGFIRTPKAIRPNLLLRQAKLLTVGATGKITDARVNVVPEGGVGLVYCNVPGEVERDRQRVKAMFEGQEGVAEVLDPSDYGKYGLPHPREYRQAPDLILVAKEGYGVSNSTEGETFATTQQEGRVPAGTHGFLSTNPKMNAICVLSGRGIRRGAKLETTENISIAPTVAKLLGLKDFQADGKPLDALLEE